MNISVHVKKSLLMNSRDFLVSMHSVMQFLQTGKVYDQIEYKYSDNSI